MLPLRVFVVSLLLPAGTLCISSHSPLDLFAYPAYAVKLNPASPISNTSAEAILAAAAASKADLPEVSHEGDERTTRQNELDLQDGRNADLLGLHDNDPHGQQQPHDQQLNGPVKPYLLRSSSNGQAYLCSVPQPSQAASPSSSSSSKKASGELVKDGSRAAAAQGQPQTALTEAEKEDRRAKNELEKKEAFERGLALLEPLKGTCLYLTQGWFTYAFCYGSEIRQFHAVKNPSPLGPPLIEDLTQDAYTLGLWSNRLTQDEGLVDVKKARALGSLREILASEDKSEEHALEVMHGTKSAAKYDEDSIGDERRYLVQRWTGGTLCDKTGVERSIEVQFHCNSQSSDRIFLVRETAICEYVIVIHTPRLCGEPIFVGGSSPAADDAAEKKKKELNVIECRPVVRDELYLQYLNAGKNDGPGEARGLPEAASDETSKVTEAGSGDTAPASEPADTTSKEGYPKQDAKTDSTQDSLESSKQGDTSADSDKDKAQIEEFVLGSYTLVYDRDTGEMTVNPDPADLVKSELEAGKSDEAAEGMTQNEAEAMEALLNQFRKSLEEMMQNVGGALKNAKSDATSIQDTIKKVQEAYEAAASGPAVGGPEDTANLAKGGKDGQEQAQSPQKADPISRLTRTGAHNHREIAEKYLKGQLGLPAGKKPKFHHTRSEPGQLHRQREAKQQKMGTAQFRNLKRAFEQKWDDGSSDNASPEEKSEGVDKAKNVPPPQQPPHPAAAPRGHDEL